MKLSFKTAVCAAAIFSLGVAAFAAETKVGKVTALTLDPETDKTTVTVTLGTLQLPSHREVNGRSKVEIVALGEDKTQFVLDEVEIALFSMDKSEPKEEPPKEAPADEANGQEENAAEPEKPAGQPPRKARNAKEEGDFRPRIDLGTVVQLTFAEDGETVESVELVPDFPLQRNMKMPNGRSMELRPMWGIR